MIKTYEYTKPMNTVSHVLTGNGGNTARFNFINGNVITKQNPKCTLRGKYFQDLLESSELFEKGYVRLIRSVREPSDDLQEEQKEVAKENDDEKIVNSVTTDAELIAFVNETAGRTEKNEFHTTSNALKWATANGYSFPKYNPD